MMTMKNRTGMYSRTVLKRKIQMEIIVIINLKQPVVYMHRLLKRLQKLRMSNPASLLSPVQPWFC